MKLKPIGGFLNKNGFIKNGNNDFYKVHDNFVNCINFQKKSTGDIFFINTGVHPV
ncbi:DUF4304 domain-containing protein, partial [Escherichia coli]|nr:DUF4304 domain-containing protein [Escherichia coli]